MTAPHRDPAVARLIEQARAEGAAEALRSAADKWQVGDWANVLLPAPTPPAVPVIAYSNRVLDWLRERADQIGGASCHIDPRGWRACRACAREKRRRQRAARKAAA